MRNHTGHAIAIIADDGRNHEAAEARKREYDASAREAQNRRHAAITQEVKAIQPVLASLGISAFIRPDTVSFNCR